MKIDPSTVPAGTTHYCKGSCMPFERLHEGKWFAWDEDEKSWWPQGPSAAEREMETGQDLSPAPIGRYL